MVIVKGTNVFPSQIEEAIMKNSKVGSEWLMIIDKKGDMDELIVQVESKEKYSKEEKKKIAEELRKEIRIITTLNAKVEVLDPDTLPRHEGKAKRVIDKRK